MKHSIYSIECDYIPKPGDDVQYKKCLVPPKNEKYSAIHVKVLTITRPALHNNITITSLS